MSAPRLLVTLCTYNERENISEIVPAILQETPHATVLVIDDNSPDGTGRLADELSATDGRVRVLHRPGKQGLGTAILAGFKYGIEHGFDWLVNLDADFSHHPRHLPALLACMDRCDVAIGSRYVKGGGVVGWGFRRHFMSRESTGTHGCCWAFAPVTTAAAIAVTGCRSWRNWTSTGSVRAGTRFRRRPCTAVASSVAGSRKRQFCSRTGGTENRR